MASLRNSNAEQWLREAQQGLDYSDPNAVANLYRNLQAAGRPVEYSGSGDLIRFLGDDAGTVDVLQNKAFEQGRGPVRGWAFQPFYGKDDFNRLRSEGRNPHTGDFMGQAAMNVGRHGNGVGLTRPPGSMGMGIGSTVRQNALRDLFQPDEPMRQEQPVPLPEQANPIAQATAPAMRPIPMSTGQRAAPRLNRGGSFY